ncbi:MAG: class I SAM-dependent methyltransferase [Candidatus Pacearchaeota archaeon]|jgi:ubiquinone/menaquinone biosynthesis C-methylase UbiE
MDNKKIWSGYVHEWNDSFLNDFDSKKDFSGNSNIRFLLKVAMKKDKILDQGCGIGQYPLTAYKLGFKNVTGLDFSKELIRAARKNAEKLNYKINFIEGDIRKMPFEKSEFDIVISAGIVEHVPETKLAIAEISRVLKNKGYLIIHVPQKISVFTITKKIQQFFGLWKCGYEKSFTKKYFSNLLKKNNFEIIEFSLPPFRAGKHKILGGVLEVLDKPLHALGFGGHHMSFLCMKK